MNRFRQPALIALWLQVAATFGVAAFSLWQSSLKDELTSGAFLNAFEATLAGVVLAWWSTLFGRITLGQGVPPTDGTLRALAAVYPWLTTLRGLLWLLLLTGILSGYAETAHPVALTALMTIWAGAIVASNAVCAGLVRLAAGADEEVPQQLSRLADWLNLSAALSLGMTVMNVVPIQGLTDNPDLRAQVVYGLGGLLDVVATMLSFRAVLELLRRAG